MKAKALEWEMLLVSASCGLRHRQKRVKCNEVMMLGLFLLYFSCTSSHKPEFEETKIVSFSKKKIGK